MVDAIISFFGTIYYFISTLIDGVLFLLTAIPQFSATLTFSLAYAPAFLGGFLVLALSVTVLFAIIKIL